MGHCFVNHLLGADQLLLSLLLNLASQVDA